MKTNYPTRIHYLRKVIQLRKLVKHYCQYMSAWESQRPVIQRKRLLISAMVLGICYFSFVLIGSLRIVM